MMTFWQHYRQHLDVRGDLRDIRVPPPRRVPALDGLRALGILLVIGLHAVYGASRIVAEEHRAAYIASLPRAWDIFWQARGSNIIFMLCGLLVTLVLLAELDKQKRLRIASFYGKRLVRIVPLYVVAIFLFIWTDLDNARYLWSNLLFIANLVPGHHMIVPVGWSMDVQVQFYALLPWLLLLLSRSGLALLCLAILLLLAPLLRYAAVMAHSSLLDTPFHVLPVDGDYAALYGDALYYNLYTRLTPFLVGIGAAWIWHYRPPIWCAGFANAACNTALLLAGFALIFFAVRIGIQNPADAFYHPFDEQRNLLYMTLNESCFSMGMGLVTLCMLFGAGPSVYVQRLLGWRGWHPLSELVYGLYLFHFIGLLLAAIILFAGVDRHSITVITPLQVMMIFGLGLCLSLFIAALASIYIEKPFMRMGRHWLGGP